MITDGNQPQTSTEIAKALPTKTKRLYWRGITEQGLDSRQARLLAGIDSPLVAARLFVQCHNADDVPMSVDEIH